MAAVHSRERAREHGRAPLSALLPVTPNTVLFQKRQKLMLLPRVVG